MLTLTPLQDDDSMDAEQPPASRTRTARPTDVTLAGPSRPRITTTTVDQPSSTDTSTETSTNSTPIGSNTPTGAVEIPGRERSGTIIARPVWDPSRRPTVHTRHREREIPSASTSADTSANNSRPETETEDDGDGLEGDVDMMDGEGEDRSQGPLTDTSPSPEPMARTATQTSPHTTRRAVGIVSDTTPTAASLEVNADAHIIINRDQEIGVGGVGMNEGVGVEEGIVSLEPNDDFAMGAPPGAPGAIETTTINMTRTGTIRRGRHGVDVTPRAGNVNLPIGTPRDSDDGDTAEEGAVRPNAPPHRIHPLPPIARPNNPAPPETRPAPLLLPRTAHVHHHHHHHHHRHGNGGVEKDSDGPYRDEDVLLSLQLLAYLSKYPHVRQAFYKPRASFHPATVGLQRAPPSTSNATVASSASSIAPSHKESTSGFFKAFGRGKEKERAHTPAGPSLSPAAAATTPSAPQRQTNVFSLVERFTFRPSSSESDLPNPPPSLPQEIQYWAGVIMRNACRKDDSRGGIRQCANSTSSFLPLLWSLPLLTLGNRLVLCGRWESYPREFAKCRRCRKAKYCGKECQSTAWSEGHRFWCSAKDGDDEATEQPDAAVPSARPSSSRPAAEQLAELLGVRPDMGTGLGLTPPGPPRPARVDRERERDRERVRERVVATTAAGVDSTQMARAMAQVFRNMDGPRAWTAALRDNADEPAANPRRPGAPAPVTWNARPGAAEPGWGRAVYEPSPFGATGAGPSGQQGGTVVPPQGQGRERRRGAEDELDRLAVGHGRRRAETMPGGIGSLIDAIDAPTPLTHEEISRFFAQPRQPDVATAAPGTQAENPRRGLEVEVAIAGPSNARIMGMRGDTDVGMDDESFRMGRDDFPMDVD